MERLGIREAFTELTLLRDREDSNAWSEWLELAGLPPQARRDVLIVPDPNVRVQAVINGVVCGRVCADTLRNFPPVFAG